MKLLFTIFFMVVAASAHASSDFDGNDMLKGCEKLVQLPENPEAVDFDSGLCAGVISGVIHASQFAGFEHGTKLFCIPEGVPIIQLARIMNKHLNESPEVLHVSAGALTTFAFSRQYPCE